jgi:hypothetical protein
MTLFFGVLFGAIGSGYLLYAKRQYDALFAIIGFALLIFPYFVDSVVATFVIGAVLCAAPFAIRKWL